MRRVTDASDILTALIISEREIPYHDPGDSSGSKFLFLATSAKNCCWFSCISQSAKLATQNTGNRLF